MTDKLTLASVPLLALAAVHTAVAQAVDSRTTRRTALEEVVVTATRIATDLQDTPIAITAVTSDMLEVRGLQTTADLGHIIPNAVFRKTPAISGPAVSVSLRGIGRGDPQLNGEPAVAYYIDDIYFPFLFGSQFDLLDVERVEVLRGPQGTLFGRNSIAGAVNMVSRRPSFTESSVSVEATFGSFDRRDVRASFSVPLTETLALNGSTVLKNRTGYQEMIDFACQMHMNGTPELAGSFPFQTPQTSFAGGRIPKDCVIDHLGGEKVRAFRGSLYWIPTDRFEIIFAGDHTDQRDDIAALHVFEMDYAQTTTRANFVTAADQFSIPGTPFRWDERFETGDPYKTYDNFCDPFPAGTLIPGNTYYNGSIFKGGKCYGNVMPLTNQGLQFKLTYSLTEAIDFMAIAGHREMDLWYGAATDGTVLNDTYIYHEFDISYSNGELRLVGQHDRFDWSSGLFYYTGSAEHLGQPQGVRAGTQRFQVDHYYPDAWAIYSNVVFRATDRLNVTAGLRYSDDKKGVDFNSLTDATPPGQREFVPATTSTIFDIDIQTERWDWKAGLDLHLGDNVMLYTSAGSGYRLPGFNVRPSQPGQEGQTPGEALISYEFGTKSELLNGRLKTNTAVFFMDFTERPASFAGQEAQLTDDLQGYVPGNSTVVPAGPPGTAFEKAFSTCRPYDEAIDGPRNVEAGIGVACVARGFSYEVGGQIKGFEAEFEAEPIDNLLVNASFGYTEWQADERRRQTGIPKWTASAGVQYRIPAERLGGTITPRLDAFYNGRIAYDADRPEYDQPGRTVVNARITYRNEVHDMDIALGATNLFDKLWYYNKTIYKGLGLTTNIAQPAPPREWYLSIRKRL